MEQADMQALLQKLDSIEKLNRKIARGRIFITALLLCLVIVLGVGLFALNNTVATATEELPALIQSLEQTSGQMHTVLGEISTMDFKALNESIQSLRTVAESLAQVTSIFQ